MAGLKPDALGRLSGEDLLGHDGIMLFGPNWDLVQRLKSSVSSKTEQARAGSEVIRLSSADVESQPGRLLEELQSISLFGGFKIVVVEATSSGVQREVISALSLGWTGSFLAVVAGDLKKSSPMRKEFEASPRLLAVVCYEQSAGELANVARQLLAASGIQASSEVCAAVVDAVAGNAALLETEVSKLVSFVGDGNTLSLEDVEAACALNRSATLDSVLDSAFAGQVGRALTGLRELRSEGASATSTLVGLTNHLLLLVEMAAAAGGGRRADVVIKQWKPPVFWKRQDAIIDQVRRLASVDQSGILEAVSAANALARRERQVEWPVLERLVLAVSTRLR
jgi:DNA polymerase-3 subunit delta